MADDTEEEREGEKERGEVERDRRRPDSLSSDLEPGRWQTEEVREPAGEVTLGMAGRRGGQTSENQSHERLESNEFIRGEGKAQ